MLQPDQQLISSIELEEVAEPLFERRNGYEGRENGFPRAVGIRQQAPSLEQLGWRVSVVIAAMNEAENLPHVFARLPEGLHELILVDGHSVDDTVAESHTSVARPTNGPCSVSEESQ